MTNTLPKVEQHASIETWPWLFCAALAIFGLPVRAGRLIARDGHVIETDGPWVIDSEHIRFVQPGGALTSIPYAEIDLDASTDGKEPMPDRLFPTLPAP